MSADQLFTTADPRDAPNHVKPEAGRCDVCGLSADQCEGVPAEVMERMRRFINTYGSAEGWKFAKTMADIPHSYAVRAKAAKYDLEPWFVWFAEAICQYGYRRAPFGGSRGKKYTYVNVDGWRYWTMGNPIDETTILNRAPLTREGKEELRRENGLRNVRWFECENGHRFGVVIETLEDDFKACRCPACVSERIEEVDGP